MSERSCSMMFVFGFAQTWAGIVVFLNAGNFRRQRLPGIQQASTASLMVSLTSS